MYTYIHGWQKVIKYKHIVEYKNDYIRTYAYNNYVEAV